MSYKNVAINIETEFSFNIMLYVKRKARTDNWRLCRYVRPGFILWFYLCLLLYQYERLLLYFVERCSLVFCLGKVYRVEVNLTYRTVVHSAVVNLAS